MIAGTIILEDTCLTFIHNNNNTVSYTVADNLINRSEKMVVDSEDFFCALAIAIHQDGEPNIEKDYDKAVKAMPTDTQLRWIP